MSSRKTTQRTNLAAARKANSPSAKSRSVRDGAANAEGKPKAVAAPTPKAWSPFDSVLTATLGVLFMGSYWPAFGELLQAWNRSADYSHGYLVAPAAIGVLWLRRSQFPGLSCGSIWPGLFLVALGGAIRVAGAWAYIGMAEAWSMIPWLVGAFWAVAGRPAMRWVLPSILFLGFMIPLPYRAETLLSGPMQSIAARVSCWTLQTLGFPAVATGNVIFIDETPLLVAEACSGLRIFMSILALAYVYLVFVPANRWIRLGVVASILPIAIFSNSLRIVGTAVLRQLTDSKSLQAAFHDASGLLMIPVAAACFWLVALYWRRLFVPVETVSARELWAE